MKNLRPRMIKDSHPQLLSRELRFEALSLDEQTHVILVICVIRPWLLSYYLYYQAGHWLSILVMLLLLNCPAVSDSLGLHGLQHARPPCPLPSPEICPSSCPLHWSWWCHPALSSSDAFLSLCLQSFPASGTFPVSQLFTSDDQNTGVSTSARVLPMSIQGWFPLRLTGLTYLLSKGSDFDYTIMSKL